jgi:putative tryptophan/tyrosine transport system substrate-binding protein
VLVSATTRSLSRIAGVTMRRREFIKLIGGAAAVSPFAARAQQPAKVPHVVFISPAGLADMYQIQLRDRHDIRIEFRDAGGYADQLPTVARQIVQEGGVDVIVAVSARAAVAASEATQSIPIVAFVASDPISSGLAKSLAHPGGNVTGVAVFAEETTVKRVELIREAVPLAVRLGTVATKVGQTPQILASTEETARKLGFSVEIVSIDDPNNIAKSLTAERLAGFDAFVIPPDAVLTVHEAEVVRLIGLSNKPAIYPAPDWAENGGLMSFGPDFAEAGQHVLSQLNRVLKGEKPSDLPFERPTRFYLSINLRTARAMGIEFPPAFLARADKVIE